MATVFLSTTVSRRALSLKIMQKTTSSMGSAVFDEGRFLEVLLTTTMSEVKEVIDRDDRMREGNERTLASFSFSSALNAAAAVKVQTGLLLLLLLGTVLIQQLEQLFNSFLIQCVRELGNGGWDLETLV